MRCTTGLSILRITRVSSQNRDLAGTTGSSCTIRGRRPSHRRIYPGHAPHRVTIVPHWNTLVHLAHESKQQPRYLLHDSTAISCIPVSKNDIPVRPIHRAA